MLNVEGLSPLIWFFIFSCFHGDIQCNRCTHTHIHVRTHSHTHLSIVNENVRALQRNDCPWFPIHDYMHICIFTVFLVCGSVWVYLLWASTGSINQRFCVHEWSEGWTPVMNPGTIYIWADWAHEWRSSWRNWMILSFSFCLSGCMCSTTNICINIPISQKAVGGDERGRRGPMN